MTELNPIQQTSNKVKPLSIKKLKKMNEASIFNKFDTDQSGTITNQELTAAGYVKDKLIEVKHYLIERFGREKITNVKPGENYFDYTDWERQVQKPKSLDEIPLGSHSGIRDARACDISGLDLSEEELLNLCVDKTTVMSPEQKAIIDVYTEKAKDPGLGIRNLHEQGITGKGVRMAIIDQPLGKHQEYSSNIVYMEDINSKEIGWDEAEMHGAAVASIAVGKECGVAPDADLVYFSAVNLSYDPKDIEEYRNNVNARIEELKANLPDTEDEIARLENTLKPNPNVLAEIEALEKELPNLKSKDKKECEMAIQNLRGMLYSTSTNKAHVEAINKILDMNKGLPDDEKVTVISISWGFDEYAPGYKELQEAVQRAKDEGVFVVSTALQEQYGFSTNGANRNPKGDFDSPDSYEAGAFWKNSSEADEWKMRNDPDKLLIVPMDHRTVADFTDGTSYRYEGNDGGMSWSTPWLAGTYVLAKQVKPDITPEEFWRVALETSNECHNNDTGTYSARLINPQKLIETLQQ